MLKVFKRISIIIMIACISIGQCNFSVSALQKTAASSFVKDTKILTKIDKLEAEINTIDEIIATEVKKELNKSTITVQEKESIQAKYKRLANEQISDILFKYGFEPTSLDENFGVISPKSSSNSLTITNQLYYDSSLCLYRFQGDWDFDDSMWDLMVDIEDIAGVRMINESNYHIYSSYCKTWDNWGNQTGYVDSDGQHTPSNSKCTKRMEDSSGVAYNIIDTYANTAGINFYLTDKGRITQYIQKLPGATINKVFLDYNHNFKKYIWSGSASISTVDFSGLEGALKVTYSAVSGVWQRCSGGKTIY